jgi:protease-4
LILPFLVIAGLVSSIGSEIENQAKKGALISGSGEDVIALVNIDGIIVEKKPGGGLGSFSEDFTSARKVKNILSSLSSNDKVKAVILRVNSPGGSAVASEEIYREILKFKKVSGKKVVAYFSDIAASGGYYVAVASDKIVANPSNLTGSIGVIISYLNFEELASKYGVKNIVFKSGPHKDLLSEFRQPTEKEKSIIEGLIDDSYENFVKAVSQGRGLTEEEVKKAADGRIYSAKSAMEMNLIDEIGGLDQAIGEAQKLANLKEASVIEYGQSSFWESILENLSGRFNVSLFSPLDKYLDSRPGLRIFYLYSPSYF